MKILILGAGGMIGRKLTARLIADGGLGATPLTGLVLADVVPTPLPAGAPAFIQSLVADMAAPGEAEKLVAARPDVIFHLAAIVSGEAEADFAKGYRVNFDATRALFEAIRLAGGGYKPRLIFTSSIAVFGAPFPDAIPDDFFSTPYSSYGTQKAMAELLVNDYSRRGFFDGISLRLPTICIRPGKPNAAASGFYSGILREPLAGRETTLPVDDSLRHWFASPRAAIGFLIHAATMDLAPLGRRRALNLPGVSATVGDEIEALRRAAGDAAVALIKRKPDPTILKLVEAWPRNFDPARARELGFTADASMDEIIAIHRADEA